MKILVTGGAGFIGSHVVDTYIAAEHQVIIVDNLSSGLKANLHPQATFYQLDLNDEKLSEIVTKEKPDLINHHAAQINVRVSVDNPQLDATTNILGSLNLFEAAKKSGSVKKIIFASTGGAIYGDANILPTPESYPALPISPYGISKLSVEHYLYYYQQIHGIDFVALRYGNVYGPRQNPHGEAGVVAIFYNLARENHDLTINGDGSQTRDFVFVDDVARANLLATQKPVQGIINIGTGIQTSVNQLTEVLVSTLKTPINVNHGPAKTGEQKTSCLDNTKAREILSWQPQTDINTGLNATARFFLD